MEFLRKGRWEATKVRFTWRRVFRTKDKQVVKDVVYTGQHWAAKQPSEILSPRDRRQKDNRGEGSLLHFPLKTAGREQHSALHSGEAEVGRGRANLKQQHQVIPDLLQRFSNNQPS